MDSKNGKGLQKGEGLADVAQKIRREFSIVHEELSKNIIDTSAEISIEIIDPVALNNLIKKIPTQPLREHSTTAVGRHRTVCHHIRVPKRSAQELIDAAIKARSKNAKT